MVIVCIRNGVQVQTQVHEGAVVAIYHLTDHMGLHDSSKAPPLSLSLPHSLFPSCECCVMFSDITRSVEQQV